MAESGQSRGPRPRQSTSAFRLINPELFIKPNKTVMSFGIAALFGCVMYLGYMTMSSGNNKQSSTSSARPKKSKWD